MATGLYASQDELLLEALQALDDIEQSVADIQEGVDDELAGRLRSIIDVDREIGQELGFNK